MGGLVLNRAGASEKENGEGVGNGCCDWELADTGDTPAMGLQATTNISPSCFIFLVCCPSPTAPSFKEMVPQTASSGFLISFRRGWGEALKSTLFLSLVFTTFCIFCVFLLYYPWSFQEGWGIDGKVKNGL